MPNNTLEKWEEKTLKDLCEIEIGKTPNRSTPKFWDKELITNNTWLSIADLNNAVNKEVFTSKERVSDIGASNIKIVKQGTLLLSFKLTIGRVAFAGKDLYTNEAIAQLPIKNSREIDKNYLYYYLQYFNYDELLKGDVKVKGKTLNKEKLKALPVLYPELSEQQRIVGILDEAFENIEKAKQNTLQNLNNAKELFESSLNNTLKNIENKGEFRQLSTITEVKDGTHDSPKYVKEGIPFITQKNIRENGFNFITDDTKYITEEDHDKFYKRSNVKKNDILISMIGANRGMACIVDVDEVFSIKNVGLIKDSQNISRNYLLYYLKSNYAKQYISEKSKGGAQEFVGLTALRAYPILYVSIEEQQKIVEQLDELQEETKKLEIIYEQKLKDLDELKQSLLQKAFNGEL